MTHTPGPWKVEGDRITLQNANDGFAIAFIDHLYKSRDEREANARLIAAAPELLEACLHCLKTLEHINNSYLHFRSVPTIDKDGNVDKTKGSVSLNSMEDILCQAIAKAEGK